jgi:hypothetical protein
MDKRINGMTGSRFKVQGSRFKVQGSMAEGYGLKPSANW